jgi:hypothetical protein
MKNCGCYLCREIGETDHDKHGPKELRWARKVGDGTYYWGPDKHKAKRGRWVKICKWCVDAMSDGDYSDEELRKAFF